MTTHARNALACAALFVALPAAAETPAERGAYLVESIAGCGNCHTQQGPDGPLPGMALAGGMPFDESPHFVAYASNITPDVETGIGGWTDDELVAAIREGRDRDGSTLGPPMPFGVYRGMADDDVRAIVAYLRTVPAVKNEVPDSVYDIPLPPSYGPPVSGVEAPPATDQVAYGAYLAGPMGHCIECHTPMGAEGHPDFENQLGRGGFEFHGPWGVSKAANITSDPEHGLGAWTDEEIARAITRGIGRDGRQLLPPMGFAYYAKMTPEDVAAIVAYLRTLPPVKSE